VAETHESRIADGGVKLLDPGILALLARRFKQMLEFCCFL
jgi:hypothetical protein